MKLRQEKKKCYLSGDIGYFNNVKFSKTTALLSLVPYHQITINKQKIKPR